MHPREDAAAAAPVAAAVAAVVLVVVLVVVVVVVVVVVEETFNPINALSSADRHALDPSGPGQDAHVPRHNQRVRSLVSKPLCCSLELSILLRVPKERWPGSDDVISERTSALEWHKGVPSGESAPFERRAKHSIGRLIKHRASPVGSGGRGTTLSSVESRMLVTTGLSCIARCILQGRGSSEGRRDIQSTIPYRACVRA